MEEEKDLSRYFACMNLFIFSMLLLVLAGDLLLVFVGWEGVGLASYLLIGYWYEKPSSARAATKAFIVNRCGDLGFLLGIILTFILFGTTDIETMNTQAVASTSITLLTLLLLCGALAKSAQLPLQVWLPDAMEGPTPVSALIHAATMVTAGVYLIARLHPLFLLAPMTLQIIGIVGGATALFASLAALNQTDLKRVLAYSTISQLGLMFLACGIGAFYAAMFHLTTHAFMKALLFLTAGNVIHKMHGVTDMGKMGGLSKQLPQTQTLFLIGVLAMAGIPPFAAFFSKDLILEVEYHAGFTKLFLLAVLTSILTAIYLTRAYFLTFRGSPKADHSQVSEAPFIMLMPVKILALLAVIGGFIGYVSNPTPFLEHYLRELGITPAEKEFTEDLWTSYETWFSIIIAVGGMGFASILYTKFLNRLGAPLPLLKNGFYLDTLYQKCIVVPFIAFSEVIASSIEPRFFDRLMYGSAHSALKTASLFQKMQSGQIRSYAAWMIIGGVVLLIYFTRPLL
jgi:NADH-quinone oxidoreductase subunit L